MNATRTVGMLLFYKIDQMLFLGEGREIWARSVIDHEDGYVMNCFDHNKLVAQYHPYHYENGATVHFWESPFVLFKVLAPELSYLGRSSTSCCLDFSRENFLLSIILTTEERGLTPK